MLMRLQFVCRFADQMNKQLLITGIPLLET